MNLAKTGEIYAFRQLGGGYGAVDVVAEQATSVGPSVRLRFLHVDCPDLPIPAQIGPAARRNRPEDFLWVTALVPRWAQRIGMAAVDPAAMAGAREAYGGWGGMPIQALLARIGHAPPAPSADRTPVRIDLGGSTHREERRIGARIDTAALLPDSEQAVRWQGLAALSSLSELTHRGPGRGLTAALPDLPPLRQLNWVDPQDEVIDLSRTRVLNVSLSQIERPVRLVLPATCYALTLGGSYALAMVAAPDPAEPFSLTLLGSCREGLPRGIDGLRRLNLNARAIDLEAVAGLAELAQLECRGARGGISEVTGIGALRRLRRLRSFIGHDLYGFDAAAFPTQADCPDLYQVDFDGLRAEDARILRKRLKALDGLALSKTRSDKWLAENLDNPFRDWDADGGAFGAAAAKLWKAALQQAGALGDAPSRDQAQDVLRSLIQALNRLDGKHGATIDTLRREQAVDAALMLAARHLGGVLTADEAAALINGERDF